MAAAGRQHSGPSRLMGVAKPLCPNASRTASRARARKLANSAAAEAPIPKNECRPAGCAVSVRFFSARLPVEPLFLHLFYPRVIVPPA